MNFLAQDTAPRSNKLYAVMQIINIIAFAYVLVLPTSHNYILYPVFLLIGVSSLSIFIIRKQPIPRSMLLLAIIWLLFVGYGSLVAIINQNEGLTQTLVFLLFAPILFFVWSLSIDKWFITVFMWIALIATIFISLLVILHIKAESGDWIQVLPDFILKGFGLNATFEDQASQITAYNLGLLIPLSAIWVSSLFIKDGHYLPPRWLRILVAIIASIATFAAGRQVIALVLLATPFILFLVWLVMKRSVVSKIKIKEWLQAIWLPVSAYIAGVFFLSWLTNLDIFKPVQILYNSILSFFGRQPSTGGDFTSSDQSIRSSQIRELTDSWLERPMFGHGFAAVVSDPSRHDAEWKAELQYNLFLAWTGIVGATLLIAVGVIAVIFLRKSALKAGNLRAVLIATSTGALTMLIANATNPYLQAPGHMWAIFLPLGIACTINAMTQKKRSKYLD